MKLTNITKIALCALFTLTFNLVDNKIAFGEEAYKDIYLNEQNENIKEVIVINGEDISESPYVKDNIESTENQTN